VAFLSGGHSRRYETAFLFIPTRAVAKRLATPLIRGLTGTVDKGSWFTERWPRRSSRVFGGHSNVEASVAYDLMLMDAAGSVRVRERADSILRTLRAVPALDGMCELHSGFRDPDELDCESLSEFMEEDAHATERFRSFCATRGLDEAWALDDPKSAATFLDLEWGVTLATAKMPNAASEVADAYGKLVAFARHYQLRIWDPQLGGEVDLNNPGTVPPVWT